MSRKAYLAVACVVIAVAVAGFVLVQALTGNRDRAVDAKEDAGTVKEQVVDTRVKVDDTADRALANSRDLARQTARIERTIAKLDMTIRVLGEAGVRGLPGKTGTPGSPGIVGPRGVAGFVGPSGPAGAQGMTGLLGSLGPLGPRGLTGITGMPGPPGADGKDGAKGDTGPQGAPGEKGDTGSQGPQGSQGSAPDLTGRTWTCEPTTDPLDSPLRQTCTLDPQRAKVRRR